MIPGLRRCLGAALVMGTALATAMGCAAQSARVFPSGPAVPENLLRIEVRFAEPLRSPLQADHVQLLDAEGKPVAGAFLDLPLPSADGRRVTLLLHPGRVKSGVGANLALGRALHAGSSVTLLIDDPLVGEPISKSWRVLAPQLALPSPAAWTFESPRVGGRAPLTVHLPAPLSANAQLLLAVSGPDGQRLQGMSSLDDFETTWRFVPQRHWRSGRHALHIHPELEDLAGNRACAPFEGLGASRARCEQDAVKPFFIAGLPSCSGTKCRLLANLH